MEHSDEMMTYFALKMTYNNRLMRYEARIMR